tara:strand:+ start:356 stop:952 length:597 start_codon:yes stop_codon:yes gene_type:complete
MTTYEATRYDFDGANLTGIEGVNTGLIIPFGKNDTPTGFLACDGSNVSRSTYAALFAVIGTTWGSGDGSSTFGLPDLQDKTVLGASGTKAHASTGGSDTQTPSGTISVTVQGTTLATAQIPSHNHRIGNNRSGANQGGDVNNVSSHGDANFRNYIGGGRYSQTAGSTQSHDHGGTGSFSGTAMSVLQPYAAIKYIIKT